MKCYYVEEGGYVLHRSIQGYLKLDLSGSQPDRERQNFLHFFYFVISHE